MENPRCPLPYEKLKHFVHGPEWCGPPSQFYQLQHSSYFSGAPGASRKLHLRRSCAFLLTSHSVRRWLVEHRRLRSPRTGNISSILDLPPGLNDSSFDQLIALRPSQWQELRGQTIPFSLPTVNGLHFLPMGK